MEITYREFEIYPAYTHCPYTYNYVHESYDGAPDANDHRCGYGMTVEECKRKIDKYYFDNTSYRVTHFIPNAGRVITKFTWLTDHNGEMGALSFASKVNGEIEMYIGGFQEELSF